MKTMESWVQQSDRAQAHGYAWELMMMSVFTEPHELLITSQCAKLAGNAVIIGLDEQALQRGIFHEHISIEGFMDAHVNTNSLRQGQPVPPFLLEGILVKKEILERYGIIIWVVRGEEEVFARDSRNEFLGLVSVEDIIVEGSTSYWREAIKRRLSALSPRTQPTKYADTVELKHVLKQIVVYRASLGLPWSMRGEEPILVESALGRLCITYGKAAAGKMISTVIDEPFVFQAAYNFIWEEDDEFYKHFTEQYKDLEDPRSDWEIFEHHVPYDLIYAFHKKQLKQELFSIPNAAKHRPMKKLKTFVPQFEPVSCPRCFFFEHPATIVGWDDYKSGYVSMETFTMGDFFEVNYKHGSRRGDSMVSPFYYPEPPPSGPDIVFVLRIDDQLYPVFVHNKPLGDIFPGDVEKARLAAYETRLKAYLPKLATYCPGGKYLSLIYDHPAIIKTPREGWNSGDVWDLES
ncbi:hypothetical protein KI688_011948 [Linnemannia hyalina]|uniref:Uncharacterized protein n=1 Tax=Linnemannia hyalina TaxID=64524 RepID=A0A9P8BVQ7_9FUNG|nr:hypothetical protein KI688_011948 [Linnemannia hyalina]